MGSHKLKDEIAKAKAAYFDAADKALEKIEQKQGGEPEGLLNLLNRKRGVKLVKPQKPGNN